MVRLTVEMLMRCSSSHAKKQRDESRKHFLRRLTHLHLENREIDDIRDEFVPCRNLTVLYLYDNTLTRIPLLDRNVNLAHLYLQNNRINKIEGLASLDRLTKLYLGGNSIVLLEGLDMLIQLQELHLENQQLASGEKLLFDQRSLLAVAHSLVVLNVSGNCITSLAELHCLHQLRQLSATDNSLSDIHELSHLLSMSWRGLQRLDIANNPLSCRKKYRDYVIIAAPAIEIVDGTEVTDTTRQFLRSWQANRDAIRQRLQDNSDASCRRPSTEDAGSKLRKSRSESYAEDKPTSFMMPALHAERFKKFLTQSRTHQSNHDRVDPRTTLSGLFGYDSMYDHATAHSATTGGGAGDVAGVGQRSHHVSLHNIGMDQLHGHSVPL